MRGVSLNLYRDTRHSRHAAITTVGLSAMQRGLAKWKRVLRQNDINTLRFQN